MKMVRRACALVFMSSSAVSCAAILGDDFTIADDDDGDGDGDGDGDQTASGAPQSCTQEACVACAEAQCASSLSYCAAAQCLAWADCLDGVSPECAPDECDFCYPEAAAADAQLFDCLCVSCNGSCCISGC